MRSVFVRHNCDSTPDVLNQLWDERLIALHYNNSHSVKPADYYPAGRKALDRLWQYCESGAIVGADFRRFNGAQMLVGIIPPGSKVFAKTFVDSQSGESFTYKVVKLEDTVEVPYADYPLLVGVQPRQATITGWPAAQAVLKSALNGLPLPYEASTLHPSQLEVLCYEWLRSSGKLERLLLPIGRGLIDIDILGINSSGGRVLAQVTFSRTGSDLADKEQRLLRHARPNDDIYFFLPHEAPLEHNPRVNSLTFTEVLKDLKSLNDPATKAMINEMFAQR